ncbi:hypothetical protein VTL71DRAFT_10955 [Oculimacula yallundae]|uniref:Uncharacterized protein n=1 Tax=Oculimacula yallundae TaxID=86028 RepID=A0ABR4CUN7_9HELO
MGRYERMNDDLICIDVYGDRDRGFVPIVKVYNTMKLMLLSCALFFVDYLRDISTDRQCWHTIGLCMHSKATKVFWDIAME